MLWYSKSHRSSGQKSTPLCAKLAVIAIRETACCWMTLKCSAEPKRRYVAQIAVFTEEAEPFWLRNKMYPQGQESGLRHRAAQRYAEISVSGSRFSLCHAGCVSRYNKQGLCVPQKSQSQPKSAASLGRSPQSPERKDVYGKRYAYRRPRNGKGEGEDSSKGPQVRAEYDRICEAKSVGV